MESQASYTSFCNHAGDGRFPGIRALAPARAADVVSSNIVGYNKVTLTSGYNLLGSQFLCIGQTEKDLQELIDASTDLPGWDDAAEEYPTKLMAWTGSGYTTYQWSDANDGSDIDTPEMNSKWLTQREEIAKNVTVGNGSAFWIQLPSSTSSATVTFSGEVLEGTTTTATLSTGYNLVANPFPTRIDIQSIQSTDLAGWDDKAEEYPSKLMIWTGSGYTTYQWSDANDGSDIDVPAMNSKWLTQREEIAQNVFIPVGAGFWVYSAGGSATLTFTK